jgi:hypothetical protein
MTTEQDSKLAAWLRANYGPTTAAARPRQMANYLIFYEDGDRHGCHIGFYGDLGHIGVGGCTVDKEFDALMMWRWDYFPGPSVAYEECPSPLIALRNSAPAWKQTRWVYFPDKIYIWGDIQAYHLYDTLGEGGWATDTEEEEFRQKYAARCKCEREQLKAALREEAEEEEAMRKALSEKEGLEPAPLSR